MSDLQRAYDAIREARWSKNLLPGHAPEQRAGVAVGLEMAMEIIRSISAESPPRPDLQPLEKRETPFVDTKEAFLRGVPESVMVGYALGQMPNQHIPHVPTVGGSGKVGETVERHMKRSRCYRERKFCPQSGCDCEVSAEQSQECSDTAASDHAAQPLKPRS